MKSSFFCTALGCHLCVCEDFYLYMGSVYNSAFSTAMNASHALVKAVQECINVVTREAFAASDATNEKTVLSHRDHLRMTTHFSGMGGAELVGHLAKTTTGLNLKILSQCDVKAEALSAGQVHTNTKMEHVEMSAYVLDQFACFACHLCERIFFTKPMPICHLTFGQVYAIFV